MSPPRPVVLRLAPLRAAGVGLVALPAALCLASCAPADGQGFGGGGDAFPMGPLVNPDVDPHDWLVDHYTASAEICDLPDPLLTTDEAWISESVSEDCRAVISADLGLVGDSVEWMPIMGMVLLMGEPMGSLSAAAELNDDTDPLCIHEPFLRHLDYLGELLGQDQVGPVLYNFIASMILTTTVDELPPEVYARVDITTRHMQLNDRQLSDGGQTAIYMVHEATHVYQQVLHIDCPEGMVYWGWDISGLRACDGDWTGPWGMGAGSGKLLSDAVPEQDGVQDDDNIRISAEGGCAIAQTFVVDAAGD